MTFALPEPPANLADWLLLLGLFGGLVEAARRRLVNPILKEMAEHAKEHFEGRAVRELVLRQLAPNGHEYELPPELRDKPLRDLVTKGILGLARIQDALTAHDTYVVETLSRLNEDREARGLSPLPEPPKTGGK